MAVTTKNLDINRLGTEERLELISELWDSLIADGSQISVTEGQKAELDRRLLDHRKNPDDVVSWDDARASLNKRLQG